MSKTGLIVEGGANRVYFAVGAMDLLMENNIKADYITGSSAGIANAVSFASGQIGRGLEIALNYVPSKKYLGFRHFINPKNRSLYNINYVFKEIPEKLVPFDYEAFDRFEGEIIVAETENCETIDLTKEDFADEPVCSCCYYLGDDKKWHIDEDETKSRKQKNIDLLKSLLKKD